jgi:hypothetical protein
LTDNNALSGNAGFESTALINLFTGPAGLWSLGGSLTQPIFQGGRLKTRPYFLLQNRVSPNLRSLLLDSKGYRSR